MATRAFPTRATSAPQNGSANAALPACRSPTRLLTVRRESLRHHDFTPEWMLRFVETHPGVGRAPSSMKLSADRGTSATFRERFSRALFAATGTIALSEGSPDAAVRIRIAADNPAIACDCWRSPHVVPCNASSGETLMTHSKNIIRQLMSAFLGDSPSPKRRRMRQDDPDARRPGRPRGPVPHRRLPPPSRPPRGERADRARRAHVEHVRHDRNYRRARRRRPRAPRSARLARRSGATSRPSSWPPARRSAS